MWMRRACLGSSKCDLQLTIRLGLLRRWISSGSRFAAVWGNGDYGRLGLGNLNSQWRPAVCPAFGNNDVGCPRAIACGGAHTLFLTEKGRVYATGLNDYGQLGIPSQKSHIPEPLEVSGIPKEVIQISAGYRHSSAVTVDGELYMWGNNSSGQLGLGRCSEKIVFSPRRLDYLDGFHIKMVALGSDHSIAITDEGDALSWGAGDSGRLGHGHQSSILGILRSSSEYTPRLIKNFEGVKVTKIAAGLLHSACINEKGSVFTFGERSMGRLRFGEGKNATTPSIISEIPFSQEVACGGYHTCVITSGGELYTWGSNENGCLGLGDTDAVHTPQKVESPLLKFPVHELYLFVYHVGFRGVDYSSEVSCGWKHTAVISGGKVFTWGWGGSHGTFSIDGYSSGGQLGHGNDVDYFEPTMVNIGNNLKALHISCGFNHTGAIFEYSEG